MEMQFLNPSLRLWEASEGKRARVKQVTYLHPDSVRGGEIRICVLWAGEHQ